MSAFNAEITRGEFTLVASATLAAGDPVTAAGAKGSGVANTIGIAAHAAASGDAVTVIPVSGGGIVCLNVDSSSSGVSVGDRITYATDGFDSAGANNGFATAIDAAAASGWVRVVLGHASAA